MHSVDEIHAILKNTIYLSSPFGAFHSGQRQSFSMLLSIHFLISGQLLFVFPLIHSSISRYLLFVILTPHLLCCYHCLFVVLVIRFIVGLSFFSVVPPIHFLALADTILAIGPAAVC